MKLLVTSVASLVLEALEFSLESWFQYELLAAWHANA